MELQVQVEKTSNVHRKLMIRVPAQTVARRFEQSLQELSRTVKLKGFRPGHVPLQVVKQYYGEDVRHRLFHNLIDESFQQALRSEKIRAVGRPQIETPEHQTGKGEHDHALSETQDLSFTATVEILPEIEIKGYTGLSVSRGKADVTDEDMKKVIDGLRDAQAELRPVEEARAVKMGDHVDLKFKGGIVTPAGIEEKEGMSGARVLEVGSNSLIPGFEEELVGMKAGETKTFRIHFPKEYHAEFAEKEAEFTVTTESLKEKVVPELNDDLAKNLGYEGLEDMRSKAREHLVVERAQEVDRKLRSDLLQELISKNPFDLPQSLLEAQTRSLMSEVSQNLRQQGFNDQMIGEALQVEGAGLKKKAENQVRASLLLETIFKKEGLSVSADDLSKEMTRMAASMNVDIERLRDFYEKNANRREDLDFRLKEDRAVSFLLEKAKVKQEK